MGNVLDEFDFLLDKSTFIDDTNNLIDKANKFIDNANKNPDCTFQGIKLIDIAACISIDKSDIYNETHVIFTINLNKLKDINNEPIREFKVPDFVEELQSVGDKEGTEFGYNQSHKNFIKTISIGKELKILASNVFALYKNLENINFEKDSQLIFIGSGAFACCEKLKILDLRNCTELDEIHDGALDGSGIETLKVCNTFKNIGKTDNINIKTVYIGTKKNDIRGTKHDK